MSEIDQFRLLGSIEKWAKFENLIKEVLFYKKNIPLVLTSVVKNGK